MEDLIFQVPPAWGDHTNCTKEKKVGPVNESVKGLNTYTLGVP